jgi:hypothetical protein
MTKILMNSLDALLFTTLLFSCGGPTANDTITSDTESTEAVSSEPALDIVKEPAMEKDVVAATAEVILQPVDIKKSPEPEILDASVPAKPKVTPKPIPEANTPAPTVVDPNPSAAETVVPAPTTTEVPVTSPVPIQEKPKAPDHNNWNTLLQQYVNGSGNVNYAAFKKNESQLDAYLAELEDNAPAPDWIRREAMAYWINAYNAGTIKLILKNWPVKSIMDLHGGKPWDVKWIKLGGKTYSLNGIEHDILRPQYKDARIHFAVNCAAASCPPIPNKAFTSDNLTSLLEARARAFVRNSSYNTIGETVVVSKIFDWYGEDFGDLREYLNKYAITPIPEGKEIGFREYDWALNKQ